LVTAAVILLTALVFLYHVQLGPLSAETFIRRFGVVPARFSGPPVVTSMFVHAHWLQLVVNMLYLWIFGHTVEDRLGHARFAAFYVLCGATAAIAPTAMSADSTVPIVGASGAVGGVLGGYFSLYPHSRVLTLLPVPPGLVEVPATVFLAAWAIWQFLAGPGAPAAAETTSHAAFAAHAIGFITGAVACRLLQPRERRRVEWWD
jgi:membrane associated rhomboid family serine protease